MIAMWIFAALVIAGVLGVAPRHQAHGAQDRRRRVAVLEKPLMVLVPLAAVVALVLVVHHRRRRGPGRLVAEAVAQ